jgi:hypothetical protein
VLRQEARFQDFIIWSASSLISASTSHRFYASLESKEILPQGVSKNIRVGLIMATQTSLILNPMKKRARISREGNVAQKIRGQNPISRSK